MRMIMSEIKEKSYVWEKTIDVNRKKKEKRTYNFDTLFKHSNDELALQQKKRDQLITVYLALCSFLIPFTLGEASIDMIVRGLIFVVIGVIGVLFSGTAIRYRLYKDAYWLCCETLSVLKNFEEEEIDKDLIQQVFYYCQVEKGSGYVEGDEAERRVNKAKYVKKNIISSETMHFSVIALMASAIFALGAFLFMGALIGATVGIIVGVIAFFLLLFLLHYWYFSECIAMFSVLEKRPGDEENDRRDKAFNSMFSKAWFLHVYYDDTKMDRFENKFIKENKNG